MESSGAAAPPRTKKKQAKWRMEEPRANRGLIRLRVRRGERLRRDRQATDDRGQSAAKEVKRTGFSGWICEQVAYEHKVKLDFQGSVQAGDLKSRAALRLAREWIDLNSERLEIDWRLAREGKPLEKVPPLD